MVQRWQQRNWLAQHKLTETEKNLDELRKLIAEVQRLGDARTYRTQRVVRNLSATDSFEEIRRDYQKSVVNWNDRLNSLCVGLRLYADYRYTDRLQFGIQQAFVQASEKVDAAIKTRHSGVSRATVAKLENRLNLISGSIFNLSKDLIALLMKQQTKAYEGEMIVLGPETLRLFPTWFLLKALFEPVYPSATISSAALNFTRPLIRRPQGPWIH